MVGSVVHGFRDGDVIVSRRERAVVVIHIADELGIVCITPELAGMCPRDFTLDLHAVCQLIEYDIFHVGIILHDELDVVEGVLKLCGLFLPHQFCFPVFLLGKVLDSPFLPLLECKGTYLFILGGKLSHLSEIAVKEMCAYEVVCVAQLTVGRIGGMVAVSEFTVINHHTGDARRFRIAPPILVGGRLIHIGEKGLYSFLDGVRSAERSYNALLAQRVGLSFALPFHRFFFTRRGRQGAAVLPIRMYRQKCVGVEPVALILAADVLPVGRGGRPVHQLIDLEGTEINRIHADLVRKITGNGIVLIGCDIPRQGYEDSRPWGFRGMAVGGVDDGAMLEGEGIETARLQSVMIQGDHGAADNLDRPPARPFQRSRKESAFVLHGIPFTFLHGVIFRSGFGSADGILQFFPKNLHRHFSGMPDKCRTAVAKAKC